jgi:hypothetical protein
MGKIGRHVTPVYQEGDKFYFHYQRVVDGTHVPLSKSPLFDTKDEADKVANRLCNSVEEVTDDTTLGVASTHPN